MALFAQRVEAGADNAEILGAEYGTEAAGYLLLHFGHTHGTLTGIVRERDGVVSGEQQNGISVEPEAFEQVKSDGLLDRPSQAGWLDRHGIELLAFIDNRVVKRAKGGDIVGTECDLFLPGRLAQFIGI